MQIYLKGYYGYENFGDELLLIGVINRLTKEYNFDTLWIESNDTTGLMSFLQYCKNLVKTDIDTIHCVPLHDRRSKKADLVVLGGGEVVSDARPFPYNGWNYLLGYMRTIISKKYILIGGIGTPRKRMTKLLYRLLLGRAQRIVTRDPGSYRVANHYSEDVEQYHDFAYDVLGDIDTSTTLSQAKTPYIIINVNKYLRDDGVIDTIRQVVKLYPDHAVYFFPAAWGSDDLLFPQLQDIVPEAILYDWREHSLAKNIALLAGADHVVAARLHVLLVASYAGVSFTPFVYQEKIEKCILNNPQLPSGSKKKLTKE